MSKFPQMSDDDITTKFKRACNFRQVDVAQQDRALAMWWDLSKVNDIGDAIQVMAKFGRPQPL
jgi:hypothetical protein